MNKESRKTIISTMGFFPTLTLIFITLKLTGYIEWSWLWVFSPLWISTVAFVVIGVIILIVLIGLEVYFKGDSLL